MNKITEDYCSQETIKLLDEKGFKYDECDAYHWVDGMLLITLQTVCKWLRIKHGLHIEIMHLGDKPIDEGWFRDIQLIGKDDSIGLLLPTYSSCEKACDEAIKYCLTELI